MCGAQGVGGSLESQDGGDERLLGLYSVRGGLLGRVIHQEGSRAEGGRASVCARGQRRVRDGSAPLAARRGEHVACAVLSNARRVCARLPGCGSLSTFNSLSREFLTLLR